uniref:Uncharacterized protein n=1 Tax=viral metagenome TaxID=1070528 RepID=A0A6H1ZC71_9ZZZZ
MKSGQLSFYVKRKDGRYISLLTAITAFYRGKGIEGKSSSSEVVMNIVKKSVEDEIKNIKEKYGFSIEEKYNEFMLRKQKTFNEWLVNEEGGSNRKDLNKQINEYFEKYAGGH